MYLGKTLDKLYRLMSAGLETSFALCYRYGREMGMRRGMEKRGGYKESREAKLTFLHLVEQSQRGGKIISLR